MVVGPDDRADLDATRPREKCTVTLDDLSLLTVRPAEAYAKDMEDDEAQ